MSPNHKVESSILDSSAGRVLAGGVLTAEISPLNEIARYAVLGGVLAASSGDSALAAVAYGGSTLLLEGAAALIAAPVLTNTRFAPIAERINERISKWGVTEATLSNGAVKSGVAIIGGSAISMGLEKISQPDIEKDKLRNRGLKISAGLGLLCTAEGFLIAEGISHPSPETIGAATIAVGALFGLGKWVQNKINSNKQEEVNI